MYILEAYIITIVIMSFLTIAVYGWDKLRSRKETNRRVPEIVMLTLTAFGGALGGFIGRYIMRHKTNNATKFHFLIITYLSLIVQIGGLIAMMVVVL